MLFKQLKQRLAMNALAQGEYRKAEERFRKLREKEGDSQGIRHNIAVCLMAQEKFDEAEPLFMEELEDYGECFSRHVTLGDLYYIWGKREECERFYRLSLEEAPSTKVTNILKKRLATCKDPEAFARVEESQKLLKEGRKKNSEEDFDAAMDCFERSFERDASQYQSLNEAGVLALNQKKDPRKALYYFEKAELLSDLSIVRKNIEIARRMIAKEES